MTLSPAELVHLEASFGELSTCVECGLPALLAKKNGTPMHVTCAQMVPSANDIAVRALLREAFPGLQEMDGNGLDREAPSANTKEMVAWQRWNASLPPLDLSKVPNERDSYIRHAKKKKWWSE